MNPIEFVKAHPVGVGIGVVVVIGVVLLVSSTGSTEYVSAGNGTSSDQSIAAGLQLQSIQSQASTAQMQIGAERELGMAGIAASLEAKKLETDASITLASLATNLGLAQIGSQEKITLQESSLGYQAKAAEIQAQRDRDIALTSSITAQAQAQAQQTRDILAAQTKQAEIAARPKGLFSFIFG